MSNFFGIFDKFLRYSFISSKPRNGEAVLLDRSCMGGKERVSLDLIRIWRNHFHNKQVEVRDGKRMYHIAVDFERKAGLEDPVGIKTCIPGHKSQAEKSRVQERGFERALKSGEYTEDNMLAVINPYCQAPLTAMILFTSEVPRRVRAYLEDGSVYSYQSECETEHRIPIFGLHAGRKNVVTVQILDEAGEIIGLQKVYLYTKKLPEMLSDMICVQKHTKDSASPLTFVYGGDAKYPYAFDEKGEIRYYLNRNPKAYGLFPISQGRFLFLVKRFSAPSFANPHSVLCQEMDFFGRVIREYYVPEGIHHDGCEMEPEGNLLLASSSENEYVEDTLLELERETGKIVKRLCLAEVLCEHPYFNFYDWAHINTVSYRPEDHTVLVCLRNLHTVLQLDWQTNEILWMFSDPIMWKGTNYEDKVLTPLEGMSFSYQAHAAYWLENETEGECRRLIIYDNHWNKRRPVKSFDNDSHSYVRIYEIDEGRKTVALKQSYGNVKSKIRSNGILLEDRVFSMSGYLNQPVNGYDGLITEFDKDSGEVLNQYLTCNSFYRAYPFFADYANLSRPIPRSRTFILGAATKLWTICEKDVLRGAVRQPWMRLPHRKRKLRKIVRKEVRMKNYDEQLVLKDRKSQIARVKVRFYDHFLLVLGRDHLVNKVYLEGKNAVYQADYSRTEQRQPSLFSRFRYYLTMPVRNLPRGDYSIYIEVDGCIYRTGKKFSIVL